MLKPVDILVLLRLSLESGPRPHFATLAQELELQPSEVYTSLRRARESRLYQGFEKDARLNRSGLLEFLLHGIRYAFPAQRGTITRGLPTGYAAPPLNKEIVQGDDPNPVWPYALGSARGYALTPLHKNAAKAALKSPALYELLALVDSLRDGNARERTFATKELTKRLGDVVHASS